MPKINQSITRSYHKNKPQQNKQSNLNNSNQNLQQPKMDSFVNKNNKKDDKKDIPFGMNLLSIANKFESDRNYKLLAVDAGTASGRAYSARNNDERVEILFRDLGSIYFYMFNMQNMNKWLNKIEQKGVGTRLDPVSAEFATKYMQEYLNSKGADKVSVEEFSKDMLGKHIDLPDVLKTKFEGKGTKVINLEIFKQELKSIVPEAELKTFEQIADKMSQLQPKVKGISILTEAQAKDILCGGHINNPEFLKEFFKNRFGSTFMDKYKYVAQNDLDAIKFVRRTY